MIKFIFYLSIIFLLFACQEEYSIIDNRDPYLKFSALVSDNFQKMNKSNKESKMLRGSLVVYNKSKENQKYGNQFLFLNLDQYLTKTYLNSSASVVVDFSTVEIQPNDSLKINVYWVVPIDFAENVKNIKLVFDRKALT